VIFAAGDTKPIYLQISDWLEAEILSGNLTAGEKIYSQYQLAEMFNINPATAAKGLNILADESILYKKRGLGMFITPDAGLIIRKKRREQILERLVLDLVKEARLLDIPESEIISMIKDALNRE
jgi:DNA-binding transcriptional regulator YhcF (GntR family)